MNEHIWKKLGEVRAFAESCVHFLERGRNGFTTAGIFTDEELDQLIEKSKTHSRRIDLIASNADASDTVNVKAVATGEKLTDMQDRYLTDEDDWNDGMELLEWSGFFFGGAIVHWSLIEGVSESVHEADLTALTGSGLTYHTQIQSTIIDSIHDLAKKEASV